MSVQAIEYQELAKSEKGPTLLPTNMEIIKDVKVKVEAVISGTQITVGELFALKTDSVIQLNRDAGAPIDLVVDGKIVGRGILVVVDEHFGLQITEIQK